MKTSYILTLSDPAATLENVGGKGISLANMIRAGLPVPNGFHIATEAYRQFISANDLQPKILTTLNNDVEPSHPTSLETASATISRLFAGFKIPTDITDAIRNAYLTLSTSHLALSVAVLRHR